MPTILPSLFAHPNWYTTTFIAARLGVPLRTVQYWCQSGFLARRGCKVVVINRLGGLRQCWVYIPNLTTDAILKRLPLDNLRPVALPSPL